MKQRISELLAAALLLVGCGQEASVSTHAALVGLNRDHFSYANSEAFQRLHLELDLTVDFERQVLEGYAIHHFECPANGERAVILDSRALSITRVQLIGGDDGGVNLGFSVGESDPVRGEAVRIALPDRWHCAREFRIRVDYRTSPKASAIMWLPPRLTAGGEHPFMFTQSQSIHARSWIPLQDTPSVRSTYEAVIRTPPELRAVMSATNDVVSSSGGESRFLMPQPVPSYLIALAVGQLEFAPLGEDTGVYAEPGILPAAAWEFADTQHMLDAAEAIYGPYQWGRYDLLILPPSFPYGGMENPRLSFITPSLLAGDRSLVSTIAHELAHSWSGNLVSNRTWRDIWLNEGTTTYLEARLMEILYGPERADEERVLTYQSLQELLQTVPAAMQPLAPRFETGDPDDAQRGLEYAKGQMLLEHLEAVFGRSRFDAFMAEYFDHFAFQAISSEQFLDHIDQRLLQAQPGIYSRAELEEWLYQPGLPDSLTVPQSRNLSAAAAAARRWASGEQSVDKLSTTAWSPQATVYFIRQLPQSLTGQQLTELDDALGLSDTRNAEIARAWFREVARRRHLPAYARMREHLGRFGRIYLIRPIYRELAQNGEDAQLAREIFRSFEATYHPQTVAAIERELEIQAE